MLRCLRAIFVDLLCEANAQPPLSSQLCTVLCNYLCPAHSRSRIKMASCSEVTEEAVELDEDSDTLTAGGRTSQALPPTDSGKDAYMVLVGCFLAEVFTWGKVHDACAFLTRLLTVRSSPSLLLWRVPSVLYPQQYVFRKVAWRGGSRGYIGRSDDDFVSVSSSGIPNVASSSPDQYGDWVEPRLLVAGRSIFLHKRGNSHCDAGCVVCDRLCLCILSVLCLPR